MKVTHKEAIDLLRAGEVVALPTETVYGLAACMNNPGAVEKIYRLKNRPTDNPLIVHIANQEQLSTIASQFPPHTDILIKHFWPGPLTFLLGADMDRVPGIVRANLPNIAVRMPQHPLILEILQSTGPLVAPSANLSGKPSATSVQDVEEDFGLDFPVVDGGFCSKGVESTILYFQENLWKIARLGALSPEQLATVLGYVPEIQKARTSQPICPGQHYRHYAPRAKLYLGYEGYMGFSGAVLGFPEREYPNAHQIFHLSPINDPDLALHHLYHYLRELDRQNIEEIWVDCNFPRVGLFLTLHERLQRAANVDMKGDLTI